MLFAKRMAPSVSDLFIAPFFKRVIVVSLWPKASKKAYGKIELSKFASANSDIASSISTAFKRFLHFSESINFIRDYMERIKVLTSVYKDDALWNLKTLLAYYPLNHKHKKGRKIVTQKTS